MLWSFKSWASLSLDSSKRHHASRTRKEEKRPPKPALEIPIAPDITLTKPSLEQPFRSPWHCHCGYQQVDFCPYCDYDAGLRGSILFEHTSSASLPEASPQLGLDDPQSDSALRPNKLRKSKPDYFQIQYAPPTLEALTSARPDSILSTNSRTPLLNVALQTNPNYSPLPSDLRTPNKLEKREKRRRSTSIAGYPYTSFGKAGMPTKNLRTVSSKNFSKVSRSFV